jgi:hypothetical protein
LVWHKLHMPSRPTPNRQTRKLPLEDSDGHKRAKPRNRIDPALLQVRTVNKSSLTRRANGPSDEA